MTKDKLFVLRFVHSNSLLFKKYNIESTHDAFLLSKTLSNWLANSFLVKFLPNSSPTLFKLSLVLQLFPPKRMRWLRAPPSASLCTLRFLLSSLETTLSQREGCPQLHPSSSSHGPAPAATVTLGTCVVVVASRQCEDCCPPRSTDDVLIASVTPHDDSPNFLH